MALLITNLITGIKKILQSFPNTYLVMTLVSDCYNFESSPIDNKILDNRTMGSTIKLLTKFWILNNRTQ